MLSNAGAMRAVAEKLRQYNAQKPVIDPVMVAKGGSALMQPDALDT
jgi:hydroxymethylpyrimidine/phosphomethylpyrimidine kinase